jgi:hypothetical protein
LAYKGFPLWHTPCIGQLNQLSGSTRVQPGKQKQTTGNVMKLNRMITLCAMAGALALGTGSLLAQDNGGGGGGQGGGGGGGGFGRGNFDPAAMQQRMMDNIRDQLNFTNDTDWSAVQPLVQKVADARRDVGAPDMRRLLFGNRNRGNNGGGGNRRGGGMFGTPSPEQEALQTALDQNAPAGQVKDLLAKYEAAKKRKTGQIGTGPS